MRTAEPVTERHVADLLDARAWAHRSTRFRALGWDFGFRTNVRELGAHLDVVFDALRADGEPEHWYSLVVDQRVGWMRHRLYRDGYRMLDTPDPARAFLYMLWDVNQQLFRRTPDKLLVHASAVSTGERAVVMSAASESGKTTLALGLVERGLQYLTDEAAAIDPETLLVHAYPKALSVDVGAMPFLGRYEPKADASILDYLQGQWQVTPDAIRPGSVGAPVEPGWIVLPRYVRDGETLLTPLSRAEALGLLMEQGLNLHQHGRYGFERLAEVVRRCDCYTLVMADLPSACDALLEVVGA